jgi:thiamine monophosphate synthase
LTRLESRRQSAAIVVFVGLVARTTEAEKVRGRVPPLVAVGVVNLDRVDEVAGTSTLGTAVRRSVAISPEQVSGWLSSIHAGYSCSKSIVQLAQSVIVSPSL